MKKKTPKPTAIAMDKKWNLFIAAAEMNKIF